MRLVKHEPGDHELIHDETADVVERVEAFERLASDRVRGIRPVAERWLTDTDPFLRGEAIKALLIYWEDDADVDTAIHMLAEDTDVLVRSAAAGGLASHIYLRGTHRDRILSALVRQLERDSDSLVQHACYRAILESLYSATERPWFKGSHRFERDRDVDWDLLAPWREPPADEPTPG